MSRAFESTRGLTWPLQRDGAGDYQSASGVDKIRNNLEFLYAVRGSNSAEPGEIPWRPDFGTPLDRLVFEPGTPRTRGLAAYYLKESQARYEPRVRVIDVTAETDGTTLTIEATHEIIGLRPDTQTNLFSTSNSIAS